MQHAGVCVCVCESAYAYTYPDSYLSEFRCPYGTMSRAFARVIHRSGSSKMDSQARRGVTGRITPTRLSVRLKDTEVLFAHG